MPQAAASSACGRSYQRSGHHRGGFRDWSFGVQAIVELAKGLEAAGKNCARASADSYGALEEHLPCEDRGAKRVALLIPAVPKPFALGGRKVHFPLASVLGDRFGDGAIQGPVIAWHTSPYPWTTWPTVKPIRS